MTETTEHSISLWGKLLKERNFHAALLHERGTLNYYNKVIYSVKHNTYIVNTWLATRFVSSEPSSGQFLAYRHGTFSECAHYGIQYCLQTIFILKFKSFNLNFKIKICI